MDKKGDRTKATIRKAALVLLVQKEFKDVTMKDICEAVGLSRGGLYAHYGGTDQISVDIINKFMPGFKGRVAEKMEKDLPIALTLDEPLERYQPEMLDRSGSLGPAFYEYYSGMPLSEDSAVLKQYYILKTMLCSLIKYDTDKGEFKQTNVNAAADSLPSSYQGIRMLSSIMLLDDDNIPKGMISEIRVILAK